MPRCRARDTVCLAACCARSGCLLQHRSTIRPVTPPPPVLLGKYELVRKLASGGMAEVFLARAAGPMGFEKTVVLKRILSHLADQPNFVSMFLAEARLAAQLNHPNVVQVFDFGQEGAAYFLVMEYLDGPTLRALIRQASETGRPIPFALAARLVSLACEGLAYAHEFVDASGTHLGLVHRDVSADNVLVTRNGAVKVVDFGIAKAANQTSFTRTGTVKGKFSYMSPEQLGAQPLDRRADVFALGMVLYELLCGRKPFDTTNDALVVQAIVNGGFAKASKFRPGVPDELQQVLDRALAKSRDDRYPDCRAMQADLERFILQLGETVSQYQLSQLVQELSPVVPSPATNASLVPSQASPTGLPTVELRPSGELASSAATVRNLPEVVVSSSGEGKAVPVVPARSNFLPLLVASLLIIVGGLVLLRQSTRTLAAPIAVPPEAIRVVEPPPAPVPTVVEVQPPSPVPAVVGVQPPAPTPPPPVPVEPAPPPRPAIVTAPPKPRPRPTPTVSGQVEFRVRPFGKVWVDGRLLGETPFDAVSLAAGPHQVRVQNRDLGKDVSVAFEVKEGLNVFRYSFED